MGSITPLKSHQLLYYQGDKELPGLQILKLICAFLVVQIHCPAPSFSPIVAPATRLAVPVFFMISGYFLLDPYGAIREQKITRQIMKILKIFVCVDVVLLLYTLLVNQSRFPDDYFSTDAIFTLLVAGAVVAFHLWYLAALLQALVVIFIAVRLKVQKWLILLLPIGLALNLVIGKYNFLFSDFGVPNRMLMSRNVLTIGLPCILIGMLLRRFEHKLPSTRTLLIAAFGFGIAMYVEMFVFDMLDIQRKGDIVLFTVPCAAALFAIFLRLNVTGPIANRLVSLGRRYSLDIYVWHILVKYILADFFPEACIPDIEGILVFFLTLAAAIALRRTGLRKIYA